MSLMWYLVESETLSKKTYLVIHSADVIETSQQNAKVDLVKFYRDNGVHSGKVIYTSQDEKQIDEELKKIQEAKSIDEQEKYLQEMEAMEVKMQQEAKLISDTFDSIDRVRQGIDKRMEILNKLLFF